MGIKQKLRLYYHFEQKVEILKAKYNFYDFYDSEVKMNCTKCFISRNNISQTRTELVKLGEIWTV